MRIADTGRHPFPEIRPSAFRYFALMDTYGKFTKCFVSNDFLNPSAESGTASVQVCPSPTGVGRRFDSAIGSNFVSPNQISIEGAAQLRGDVTMHVIARPRATQTQNATLFAVSGGSTDASSSTNSLIQLVILTTGEMRIFWENGTGSNVSTNTGFIATPEEWQMFTVVKYGTSLDANGVPIAGPTGTCNARLYVNGKPVFEVTGLQNCSDGSIAVCHLGGIGAALERFNGDIDFAAVYAEALDSTAIEHDVRRWLGFAHPMQTALRVEIEDQVGNQIDVTDMDGVNWVSSVNMSFDADNTTATADIELISRNGNRSLASLLANSVVNNRNNFDLSSPGVFLDIGRKIDVRSARIPINVNPISKDWISVFQGNIDQVSEDDDKISLTCRDRLGVLVDTFSEEEKTYGPGNVENEMDAIIFDNSSDVKTGSYNYTDFLVYSPVDPGWVVSEWVQRREPVLSTLKTLAGQIGGDVRYSWPYDPSYDKWLLTFEVPFRSRAAPHGVINSADVISFSSVERNLLGVRNIVRVVYPSTENQFGVVIPTPPPGISVSGSNRQGADGQGNRTPAYIELTDDDSLTRVGRRLFMEVAEDGSSQIDSIDEAFDMCLGMLQDLSEEDLGLSITLPFNPMIEINTMLHIPPIPYLWTADQFLAVKNVSHSISADSSTTTIQLRGRPYVGQKRWLRLDTRSGQAKYAVSKSEESLTPKTIGDLTSIVGNLIGRTNYFTGGRFLQIRNSDFNSYTNGIANFPDGWETN